MGETEGSIAHAERKWSKGGDQHCLTKQAMFVVFVVGWPLGQHWSTSAV